MRKDFIIGLVLLFIAAGVGGWAFYENYQANKGFSQWLKVADKNGDEYGDYLKSLKSKGLYVCAVEGRWINQHAEFRVRVAERPKDAEMHRFWWFGMSEAFYKEKVQALTVQDTFKCVWSQHFTDGEGMERYQMVFLKFLPVKAKPSDPVTSETSEAIVPHSN